MRRDSELLRAKTDKGSFIASEASTCPTEIPRTKRHTPVHLLCVLKARRIAGDQRGCARAGLLELYRVNALRVTGPLKSGMSMRSIDPAPALPRQDALGLPSIADDRHQQHPVNLKVVRALTPASDARVQAGNPAISAPAVLTPFPVNIHGLFLFD